MEGTEAALGPIDVLVNNVGVEIAAAFPRITRDELTSMVGVNLTAPLLLTHRVVPGMLDRGRGHVVFISSAAGKIGAAYQQPYAATKAGLIGLTRSLRAEYAGAPVGFSVICLGFIAGDGMYQRMVERGAKSNRILGETTTEKVAAKVVRAIRANLPEVVETGTPIRPLLAVNEVAPGFVERTVRRLGLHEIFRRSAAARGRVCWNVDPGKQQMRWTPAAPTCCCGSALASSTTSSQATSTAGTPASAGNWTHAARRVSWQELWTRVAERQL